MKAAAILPVVTARPKTTAKAVPKALGGRRRRRTAALAVAGRAAARRRRGDRNRTLATAAPAAFLGAGLVYFFDSANGKRRRKMAAQRVAGMARRAGRRSERAARYAASEAEGAAQRAAHPQAQQAPPPDDVTLARKVETEIFRGAEVPKGKINVDAVDGVVSLRGEANDADQIERLVEQTRSIPGVRGVENFLHLPGTPAPTRT